MHRFATLFGAALLISPALADDRGIITTQMQELSDAISAGDRAVWDKYLDANVIYAEEDDTYKGKADALKEIVPLPKGLSGTIFHTTKKAAWRSRYSVKMRRSTISVRRSMPRI
jgi:hypothetical protein